MSLTHECDNMPKHCDVSKIFHIDGNFDWIVRDYKHDSFVADIKHCPYCGEELK